MQNVMRISINSCLFEITKPFFVFAFAPGESDWRGECPWEKAPKTKFRSEFRYTDHNVALKLYNSHKMARVALTSSSSFVRQNAKILGGTSFLHGARRLLATKFRVSSLTTRRNLHDAFRHHPHGVLQGLAFVAEPNPNDFAVVAQLVRQCRDFVSWKRKNNDFDFSSSAQSSTSSITSDFRSLSRDFSSPQSPLETFAT